MAFIMDTTCDHLVTFISMSSKSLFIPYGGNEMLGDMILMTTTADQLIDEVRVWYYGQPQDLELPAQI